jgi:flagellar basal-body rod modification protein FlgD
VPGDGVFVDGGFGSGSFELASAADQVRVEILGPGGHVVDTIPFGALGAGPHEFAWAAPNVDADSALRFRVVAQRGTANVGATLLMRDRVEAVSTRGDTLTLELARGASVAWTEVREFN